jgi:hypothetical protein
VLSSWWRPIWRSAPLNFDFYYNHVPLVPRTAGEICSILSSHPGPARRFIIRMRHVQSKDYVA